MTGAEIAVASMIVTGISTAVSIYGQIQAGNAAEEQANYDAKIKENEALSIKYARDANKKLEAKRHKIGLGKDKNAAGSSGAAGFDDIFRDDVYTYESSALIADYNASVGQYNKKAAATSIRYEGQALKAKSRTDALATGLKGAGKMMGQYGDYQDATALGGGDKTGSGSQLTAFDGGR